LISIRGNTQDRKGTGEQTPGFSRNGGKRHGDESEEGVVAWSMFLVRSCLVQRAALRIVPADRGREGFNTERETEAARARRIHKGLACSEHQGNGLKTEAQGKRNFRLPYEESSGRGRCRTSTISRDTKEDRPGHARDGGGGREATRCTLGGKELLPERRGSAFIVTGGK